MTLPIKIHDGKIIRDLTFEDLFAIITFELDYTIKYKGLLPFKRRVKDLNGALHGLFHMCKQSYKFRGYYINIEIQIYCKFCDMKCIYCEELHKLDKDTIGMFI